MAQFLNKMFIQNLKIFQELSTGPVQSSSGMWLYLVCTVVATSYKVQYGKNGTTCCTGTHTITTYRLKMVPNTFLPLSLPVLPVVTCNCTYML